MAARERFLFRRLGRRSAVEAGRRLRRGRGRFGRLAGKRELDGRPLGGRLPGVLARARVRARDDGFDEIHPSQAVTFFHRGSPRQRARPIVGLSRDQERAFARVVLDHLVSEAERMGAGKGR